MQEIKQNKNTYIWVQAQDVHVHSRYNKSNISLIYILAIFLSWHNGYHDMLGIHCPRAGPGPLWPGVGPA